MPTEPVFFDAVDDPVREAPLIRPWRTVALEPAQAVYIFRSETGLRPEGGSPPGSGMNFTLY